MEGMFGGCEKHQVFLGGRHGHGGWCQRGSTKWLLVPDVVHGFDSANWRNEYLWGDEEARMDAEMKTMAYQREVAEWLWGRLFGWLSTGEDLTIPPSQYGLQVVMGFGFGFNIGTLLMMMPLAVKQEDMRMLSGVLLSTLS
ncbi:uncharacterized protein PODANS_1_22390 [Podospora anserina S mat+]|uniref:Podospora anserina S mat+ genomic DNA chromosome 1, supercontig 6 n=1 Tax=Podospora anserina (strain S / ATCC MYA-4624 / DSM 980 / FGSC 10383) TaxID=515849 RepID=B2AS55_PODAN|nr:uncharacterized protein PODANS_1_22390 [Podospora anserina S mat+]CAP67228.1 unnamed protein product [Podospora anserina S mat+]CDP24639.1 Putative protein of unknown function [Podospora anserina S mat+]